MRMAFLGEPPISRDQEPDQAADDTATSSGALPPRKGFWRRFRLSTLIVVTLGVSFWAAGIRTLGAGSIVLQPLWLALLMLVYRRGRLGSEDAFVYLVALLAMFAASVFFL